MARDSDLMMHITALECGADYNPLMAAALLSGWHNRIADGLRGVTPLPGDMAEDWPHIVEAMARLKTELDRRGFITPAVSPVIDPVRWCCDWAEYLDKIYPDLLDPLQRTATA